MDRFWSWLAKHFPLRMIYCDGGEAYLQRFYVCGDPGAIHYWPEGTRARLGWLPFAVYMHKFLRPDMDRDLHNHPWHTAVSLVLSGGYTEEREAGSGFVSRRLRPGRVNVIRRNTFHRVERLHGAHTWTLFVTGKFAGSWSFRERETGVDVPWRRYLGERGRL